MDTSTKGAISEARVTARFLELGYNVLHPSLDTKYDIVLETEKEFERVQVKTGRVRGGCVRFACHSVKHNTTEVKSDGYDGEVDFFAVYAPALDTVYKIPIEDAPSKEMNLRIEDVSNGQKNGINWAEDYEI